MKKSELRELREKDVDELKEQLAADRKALFQGRFERASEGKKLGAEARRLRRNIARCLTMITEKSNVGAAASGKAKA